MSDYLVTTPLADLTTGPGDAELAELQALERTWRAPTGFWGWITSVDHKSIAKRYIATALVFFLLAGLNAGLMRLQLSRPELELLAEGLRPLIEQAAATRDECVAMGMRDMAAAAEARQRELERLDERLAVALGQGAEDG